MALMSVAMAGSLSEAAAMAMTAPQQTGMSSSRFNGEAARFPVSRSQRVGAVRASVNNRPLSSSSNPTPPKREPLSVATNVVAVGKSLASSSMLLLMLMFVLGVWGLLFSRLR